MIYQKTVIAKFMIFSIFTILSSTIVAFSIGPGAEGSFFFREPKWSNLNPSGGSLVSGRGHFKPGFKSTLSDYKSYLHDPFLMTKRSNIDYYYPYIF